MDPRYSYTDADRMNPVFCIGCRAQIPDALSRAGRGLCPDCLAKINATQAQAAPPQPSPSPPPQAAPPPQAPYAPPPSAPWGAAPSACPHCRRTTVTTWPTYVRNDGAVALRSGGALVTLVGILTLCLGVGMVLLPLGLLLWLVGLCSPTQRAVATTCACQTCGFQWQMNGVAAKPPPLILTNPPAWWRSLTVVDKAAMAIVPSVLAVALIVGGIRSSYAAHHPPPPEPVPTKTPWEKQVDAMHEADARREAQEKADAAAETAAEERVRGPKPIPSAWDTICPEANAWMKTNLKDYDSLQIVNGSDVVPWGTDSWAQRIKYRARNSFGGYALEEKLFVMRNHEVTDVEDY